ncbi:hypothetical protein K438DRAFT_1966073 [Mycena galopus ATCC 62051]|nr:hypothetical protein K438DRAFT_1966073 [Mycena galopus ATCC 62051]
MSLGNANGHAKIIENDEHEAAGAAPHLQVFSLAAIATMGIFLRTVAIVDFSKSLTQPPILDPTSPTPITSNGSASPSASIFSGRNRNDGNTFENRRYRRFLEVPHPTANSRPNVADANHLERVRIPPRYPHGILDTFILLMLRKHNRQPERL